MKSSEELKIQILKNSYKNVHEIIFFDCGLHSILFKIFDPLRLTRLV